MTVEDELQASFVALDISKNNFKSLDSSTTAAISYEQLKQILPSLLKQLSYQYSKYGLAARESDASSTSAQLLGECEKITQTLSDIADLPVHSIYARYLRKHIYDPILARCERVLDPKTADQSTELLTNNTNLLLKALDDGMTRLETLSEHAIIRERVTELGEQIDDVRMELDDYLLDGSDELCEEFNNYSNSDNHETGDNFKGPDERCEMIIKQCQAILLTGLAIVKRSIELLYSSAAATTATADSPSAAESIMDSLERLSGLIDDIGCGCYSWDENDQQIIQDSLDFTKELNSIVKLSTANDDGSSIDGRLERLFATLLPKQIDRLKECYNTI